MVSDKYWQSDKDDHNQDILRQSEKFGNEKGSMYQIAR